MILSDLDILRLQEERLDLVLPFDPEKVQPASYELTLGVGFSYLREKHCPLDVTDKREAEESYLDEGDDDGKYYLFPGDFALVTTAETVNIPADYLARVEGKSSLARLGLMVHVTAGFIDPGFHGTITLEVTNLNGARPLALPIGMKIAQLAFEELSTTALRPYGSDGLGSRYQNQLGVTASKGIDQALQTVFNG